MFLGEKEYWCTDQTFGCRSECGRNSSANDSSLLHVSLFLITLVAANILTEGFLSFGYRQFWASESLKLFNLLKKERCCVLSCRLSECIGKMTAKPHALCTTLCDGGWAELHAAAATANRLESLRSLYLLDCRLTQSQWTWTPLLLERHITSSHLFPSSPPVITCCYHMSSLVITTHNHLLSSPPVITTHHCLPSSPPVIISPHHHPSSPTVITSCLLPSSPPIITCCHHLLSLPTIIVSRRHHLSLSPVITTHHHLLSSPPVSSHHHLLSTPPVITSHHRLPSSHLVTTSHYHLPSPVHCPTCSQSIVLHRLGLKVKKQLFSMNFFSV